MAYVAVILDEVEYVDRLSEPLVAGAWWKYGPAGHQDKDWMWDYSQFHLWYKDNAADGSWGEVKVEDIGGREKFDIVAARSFAVPLVDVQNEADIREKVIGPLLSAVPA